MGKDIKALELLQNKYAAFRNLPDPPEDTDKIEIFQGKWSEELDGALSLFDDIAAYINAINDQMELIRTFLNQSTKDVQQRILDIVDSIKCKYIPLCRMHKEMILLMCCSSVLY